MDDAINEALKAIVDHQADEDTRTIDSTSRPPEHRLGAALLTKERPTARLPRPI